MRKIECDSCGAPMENRRMCDYCHTRYYEGPDILKLSNHYLHQRGDISTAGMYYFGTVSSISSAPVITLRVGAHAEN